MLESGDNDWEVVPVNGDPSMIVDDVSISTGFGWISDCRSCVVVSRSDILLCCSASRYKLFGLFGCCAR